MDIVGIQPIQQDINDEFLLSSHGQLRYPFNSQFLGGIFEVKPCHIRRLLPAVVHDMAGTATANSGKKTATMHMQLI